MCRVQVLLDVPVKQPKTKPGVAGASHPQLKAEKDSVLVYALDWTERFGGPCSYLQGMETKCLRHGVIWRGGPTSPSFSLLPSSPGSNITVSISEFCRSACPLPCLLPHLEPHLLEEPTEVPLRTPGSQASCPNQQPLIREDKACQEEIQAGFP